MIGTLSYAKFTYIIPSTGVAVYVEIRAPEFGNKKDVDPQQNIRRSLGGQRYVYNRGPRITTLTLSFENLSAVEMAAVEDFFQEALVDLAARFFFFEYTNTRNEVLYCGGLAVQDTGAPVDLECGAATPYECGQRILLDKNTVCVALMSPLLGDTEPTDYKFDTPMTLEVIQGFLPSNLCG